MKLFVIMFALVLTACGTVPTPQMGSTVPIENSSKTITLKENQVFSMSAGSDLKTIRWVRMSHEDLQKKCANLTDKKISENSKFLGCAAPTTTGQCVIFTSTKTTHQILGHEVRHCYQGAFHD